MGTPPPNQKNTHGFRAAALLRRPVVLRPAGRLPWAFFFPRPRGTAGPRPWARREAPGRFVGSFRFLSVGWSKSCSRNGLPWWRERRLKPAKPGGRILTHTKLAQKGTHPLGFFRFWFCWSCQFSVGLKECASGSGESLAQSLLY